MSKRGYKKQRSKGNLFLAIVILIAIIFFGQKLPSHDQTNQQGNASALLNLKFDLTKYPQNYAVVNQNNPQWSTAVAQEIKDVTQQRPQYLQQLAQQQKTQYSAFDHLGRTQMVTSFVRYKDVVKHSSQVMARPAFPSTTKVSGEYQDGHFDAQQNRWTGTVSNNQIVQLSGYRGYLYNKSHLLAWSLGGSMDSDNIILGTRAQNVGTNNSRDPGGMAYAETKVRNYLRQNQDEVVFYQATPIYSGQELVPRGVQVQAQALKNPQALKINIWTFNAQAGVALNYQTGQASVN
ncbi:DNA/RNA non-specific endonuclease [Bombilactobacillus folatiphilus]|uniref:DNA/RNA non-specific endonuclease n=1 Tax=Bombilactobacillus folatiphilus TaxID=2923362 RepID=A0ABY4P9D9_9LACO|nr:DNA/RNA non-specific endonuclease [Bombilactobacillus folatiphilus]UQS82298.1 DNA/RNA non-specific endonuclease [Bombilactobacillus folatiphilus]